VSDLVNENFALLLFGFFPTARLQLLSANFAEILGIFSGAKTAPEDEDGEYALHPPLGRFLFFRGHNQYNACFMFFVFWKLKQHGSST